MSTAQEKEYTAIMTGIDSDGKRVKKQVSWVPSEFKTGQGITMRFTGWPGCFDLYLKEQLKTKRGFHLSFWKKNDDGSRRLVQSFRGSFAEPTVLRSAESEAGSCVEVRGEGHKYIVSGKTVCLWSGDVSHFSHWTTSRRQALSMYRKSLDYTFCSEMARKD